MGTEQYAGYTTHRGKKGMVKQYAGKLYFESTAKERCFNGHQLPHLYERTDAGWFHGIAMTLQETMAIIDKK